MEAVSVIIPTFNRVKYLHRAIQSVLNQKKFDGEVIVIDDGSTDTTAEMVTLMSDKYPITYHYTENNGPASARNLGVEKANNQLIAFLDSDDHWYKTKLEKQLAHMADNPTFRICHTGEKWLRRGQHLNQKKIHKPRHGYVFDHCLQLCGVGMSTVIITRDLFEEHGGFDIALPCCEDYDLWLRISRNTHFLLLPEPLTLKEGGRDDQLSSIYQVGMDKYRIFALQKLLNDEVLSTQQRELTLKTLGKKCEVYGNGCIKHGRVSEGEKYLEIIAKYRTST